MSDGRTHYDAVESGAICHDACAIVEITRLRARVQELEKDCERERMRLAACGTAALGYYKRVDSIANEYKSASLDDVLRLQDDNATLRATIDGLRKGVPYREFCRHPEKCAGLSSCAGDFCCAD